ncbi:hypothetical protein [Bdellovibrio sp. NC01]|uniref:hypothetical protein n=1 Tax=Bdellovibrio sp. NC01 TaxID=2220073 RepID=UPI00115B712C|nr:hypothetical protein [Bdellovibrio sp. NC01]QDK38284.1 hypothetical protein DOE51_12195 [Bdellovibrio sp. NC01]
MKIVVGILSALSMSLMACDTPVKFEQIDLGSKLSDPGITPPPVPEISFVKTSGACAADSSTNVTSCLKCAIPPLPEVKPPMSLKATQLMNIMATACPINRAYYGNKFAATTIADHLAKLNRCSPTAYPDSAPDAGQNNVVQRLLGGDSALLNKMFTGLWYKPPYSDYFETYFGLEVGQAIQVFCEQSVPNISGILVPSSTAPNPYGPRWESGDPMPDMYVKANDYRDGLAYCIQESKRNPWQPSGAPPVAKKCSYQTMSGPAGSEVNAQVSAWLAAGFKVGADLKNQGLCSAVSSLAEIQSYQGEITVGAYICQ